METHECEWCQEEFTYEWGDVFDSETFYDGELVTYGAVSCPHCYRENRLW